MRMAAQWYKKVQQEKKREESKNSNQEAEDSQVSEGGNETLNYVKQIQRAMLNISKSKLPKQK